MFEDLFRLLPGHPAILEVGPGTGQATRDLLSRGATVHAIEIGPAMAAKLREALPSPALTITIGDFEEADVGEHVFDAVFSATAYHWISPKAQVDRPVSVLKPGGVVAIVDLNQVSSPDDKGFFTAAQPVYERYGMGSPRDAMPNLLNLYAAGRLKLDELITRRYALDDVNQAYADMRSGVNIRGVVDFIPAG
jgi:trans-aconitate methyltransferase